MLRIFIVYSRKDEPLKVSLLEHLSVLEHLNDVDLWTEDRIRPGTDSVGELRSALAIADVVLLLISASFLASDLARNSILFALINDRPERRRLIIPVLLRHCAWEEHPALSGLMPLPRSRTPLSHFTGPRRDEALVEICREIVTLMANPAGSIELTAPVPPSQLVTLPAPPLSPPVPLSREIPPTPPPPIIPFDYEFPLRVTSIRQVTLTILQSATASEIGHAVVLDRNPASLGRGPTYIELQDACVSRRHAIVELTEGRVVLRDIGSAHGTSCNGMTIGGKLVPASANREVVLKNGDIIQLGPTAVLRVTIAHDPRGAR